MPDLKWFSTVANSSTIPVGGEPARSAAITPGSGTWQATGCGKVEGNLAMVTQIRPTNRQDNYYLVRACLRGPQLAANRQAVRQMLASIRFTK